MIEANENIDEVTMRHEGDVRSSHQSYQRAVSEGRLVTRSWQRGGADGNGALAVVGHEGSGDAGATGAPLPITATEKQPDEVSEAPADSETTWRHTRLAITAGLVVLLLVIWIWQKRIGR